MSETVSSVVVDDVSSKTVSTRYGTKPTYSFKANGVYYKTGFKRPTFAKGDVISFSFEEGTYGKEVVDGSVTVVSSGVGAPTPPSTAPVPRNPAVYGSGNKGVFPIPPLDGQRSIVRQNALTNARELVTASFAMSGAIAFAEVEKFADDIITIAKRFEAYTAGDLDLEAAKKEVDDAIAKASA